MDFCNVCNVVMLVITIYYKAILCNFVNLLSIICNVGYRYQINSKKCLCNVCNLLNMLTSICFKTIQSQHILLRCNSIER